MARDYRVPPSQYLGLAADRWGETDFLLTQAFDRLADLKCACGCGHWADVAHDDDRAEQWDVDDSTVCYPRRALDRYQADASDVEPGTLLAARPRADLMAEVAEVAARMMRQRNTPPPD